MGGAVDFDGRTKFNGFMREKMKKENVSSYIVYVLSGL